MPAKLFLEMKQHVGFEEADVANVRALAATIEPHLSSVADRFYELTQHHPGAREILAGSARRAEAARDTLLTWLRGLFAGEYGPEHARSRAEFGRTHLRVDLPQHFMIITAEIVWQELARVVRAAAMPDQEARLASLHKLLMVEVGLMLSIYQESYAGQVRQVERDAMQARLREAEQLAQIGQLAASLAHEIKNPLAGISGAIQVIRANLAEDDPHWPVLGEVLRQINRLDRSVKDLLVYARPKSPQYQRCDLPRAFERVLSLLRKEPEFGRVRFEYSLSRELPTIVADEHQLEQLVMNLLLNAAQASSPGGLVRLRAMADGTTMRMVVEDHGCGMSVEVARRALEPFFTTKARGTGLGLPICRKIVEAHDGQMSIRSTPGEGTEVTVELSARPVDGPPGADDESTSADRRG